MDKVKAASGVRLPEKYQILSEFFNCLESSIRLLRIKGSMATFPNVCTSIQHLSGRRFTYSHLAKLKYVLPEAIVIKKILLRDAVTCCMRPDLQVSLLVDAVESNPKNNATGYSILRGVFQQRLVDYFQEHPEGDDVPEHELPHPFNQTNPISTLRVVKPSVLMPSSVPFKQQPVVLSHMSPSFKRRFSQEYPTGDSLIKSSSSLAKEHAAVTSPLHRTSLLNSHKLDSSFLLSEGSTKPQIPEKGAVPEYDVYGGTPVKSCSTPVRLMVATPTPEPHHAQKRPLSALTYTAPQKESKRSVRTKLFATPPEDRRSLGSFEEENQCANMLTVVDNNDDSLSFLPEFLLQSVKQKEKRALEEKAAGFADSLKKQKVIACLPGTFDIIFLIYQSGKHTVMTKQELIHKIITSSTKIVERGEVEEQLRLLQELIPDWISEKTARTGNVLYRINTTLSQTEIRQRLCRTVQGETRNI